MDNNINQEEVFFSDENIFFKISEILKKNGIVETAIDAMFSEKPSSIGVVFNLSKDLAAEKISEKELVGLLQKQLNIPLAAAKDIAQNIKEKITPLAEKIRNDEHRSEEKPKGVIPAVVKKSKIITSNITKPSETKKGETPNLPKKPDSYRELIE